ANLRLLFGFMYGHPGKKLVFMGQEFAQRLEWNHDRSLDWHLLEQKAHQQMQRWLKELNYFYKTDPAMYENDFDSRGFEWMDCCDWERGIISYIRWADSSVSPVLVVCNFTPLPRTDYKIGIPLGGFWKEVLNSDAKEYGGSGYGNLGGVEATPLPAHGRSYSLLLVIPPLAVIFFKQQIV
ncbi:MAG: alpha amylase C-terminal domain-containing protein, partial [Candidatus Omnitrophota bacterium]